MNTQEILQGIKDWAAPKVIYDISASHNNTKYTDLSDALGTKGGNIPQEYRKGGITVRYVQTSDNKYVQYRLMSDTFNTTPANWQGVDDEPTVGSDNLVKSGGVFNLGQKTQLYFSPVWRSSRRLIYEKSTQTIKIAGYRDGGTSDAILLSFFYKGVQYIIRDTVASRVLSELGGSNDGIFLPESQNNVNYTLSDFVVFSDNNEHEGYVKIAHLTWKIIGQSDVILNDELYKLEQNRLAIASLTEGFNYNEFVIPNMNIRADGTMAYYSPSATKERGAIFYKLTTKGVPDVVKGCVVLAYQWYSGYPDYVTGSNSLGRTTTPTPPANATYGGLTINLKVDYSNITISPYKLSAGEITSLGSFLNNSVGEGCFANGVRTNLKILAYGNSFMRNSVAYLSEIAKNGCNVNLTVGNLYTGGTELQDHYNALVNNSESYGWYKYVNGSLVTELVYQSPMVGLLAERWDAIIIHQYIPWQNPFEPTLNNFLKLIIDRIGYTPKIYINATWAGSLDGGETYYGYQTEEEMWAAMLDYVKQACEDSGVQEYSIIPTGTAIQNARTLSWADSYNRFVNAGTDLHHLNPAGGFIAACTLYEKIVAPLNGIHCSQTTFRITSSVAMPPSNEVQQGILVTDENYSELCKCAVDAVGSPYSITQQST